MQVSTTQYLEGMLVADSLLLLTMFHRVMEFSSWLYDGIGGWCQFATFISYVSRFLSIWWVNFQDVTIHKVKGVLRFQLICPLTYVHLLK